MLYQLHELQRRFLNPLSVWAQATSELFSSPYSPLAYTPFSRRLAAGYELLHRIGKSYEKPDLGFFPFHNVPQVTNHRDTDIFPALD